MKRKNEVLLELKNVEFELKNKRILHKINLKVQENEIHSILGVNGTGKTTLSHIIMGLNGYKPTKGKMYFKGMDITNMPIDERAKLGITLAWQNPAYFEGLTVKEYLSINKTDVLPQDALKMVGLEPIKYLLRIVDENLSGGERKRIELASVITMKPKLAILDEPDSGIDMISLEDIKNIILNMKSIGTSVILITHRDEIADISDRASLICHGEIIKVGKPTEVRDFFARNCEQCDHVGNPREDLLK